LSQLIEGMRSLVATGCSISPRKCPSRAGYIFG
jgi:hypothetical protein